MAHKYLGEAFDIHGGGIDLRFPHHENEQAQSRAAGWGFTSLWMHNAWVTVNGEKMSKSLDNSMMVDNVLQQAEPVVLRYALGAVHYRSALEFSESTLGESAAAWERITGFLIRAADLDSTVAALDPEELELPETFIRAMNEDLNVSAALAVVHERVRAGNTALAGGGDAAAEALQLAGEVRAMLAVLGLDPYAVPWAGDSAASGAAERALETLVGQVLAGREQARAAKDWARADELRDQLLAAGVLVEDSPAGARWTLRGGSDGR